MENEIKMVNSYRALDGKLFETYNEALNYNKERQLYEWYADHPLLGDFVGSKVGINDFIKYLNDNSDKFSHIFDKNDKSHELLSLLVAHCLDKFCIHANTQRLGSLGEECLDCEQRWSDKQGGKPELKHPDILQRSIEFIKGISND